MNIPEKMKRTLIFTLLAAIGFPLLAQQWVVPVPGTGRARDLVAVDGGEHVLYVGSAGDDGLILMADRDGGFITRQVHLPGMSLQYYSAIQLGNGDYMAFGICDDSLADFHYQRYMQVDVFDSQLESVSSATYDMDDEVTDLFSFPWQRCPMKPIMTRKGTVLLAATPNYRVPDPNIISYRGVLRFFEFDENGELLRVVDNPADIAQTSSINAITYAPNSDNLMLFVVGGQFGNASGVSGVIVADTSYAIVAKQSLYHLGGVDRVSYSGCDGYWIDGRHVIVDATQYIGSSFTFHTLFKVDSALNVHARHVLEPADSCVRVPIGRNTAYVNDSTIFAVSFYSKSMQSGYQYMYTSVALFDTHLNLIGRKVIDWQDDVRFIPSVPAVFNDGGCLVQVLQESGWNYPGDPFERYELMKFRREDIEITWDVVREDGPRPAASAYPNPTRGNVNIPVGEASLGNARLRIFDTRGQKRLDCALSGQGNLITLDVQNLEAGMYVYQVVSGNTAVISGKFVKE